MLAENYTLNVDVLNNGTTEAQNFVRFEEYLNRSLYKGPAHSLISRDVLGFYRTMPTKSGNFNGVAKSSFKLTTDKSVPGVDSTTSLTAPQIGEVNFSLPVGSTAADVKVLRQRMIALLDNDTIMVKLSEQLEV